MHFNLKATVTLLCMAVSILFSQARAEIKFASNSALSSGRWVKVRADRSGIFRITNATLRSWGFSNPSAVSIAGYGSVERAHSLDTAPDDLPPVAVYRTAEAIYFYAEGPTRISANAEHRNFYSSSSYYFVTDNASARSPEIETLAAPAEPGSAAAFHLVIDRRRYTDFHPYGTGSFHFSRNLAGNPEPVSETWQFSDIPTAATLTYQYIALPTDDNRAMPVIDVEGARTSAVRTSGITPSSSGNLTYLSSPEQEYSLSNLDPEVTVSIKATATGFSLLAIDHLTLSYTAPNTIHSTPALWHFNDMELHAQVSYTTPEPDALVWDVTEPRQPVALSAATDGDARIVTAAHSGNVLLAVANPSSSSVPQPVYEGVVENQNLHAIKDAGLLIVTTDMAYAQAMRLAEAHRQYQGMKTAVVRQSQVFNEFSSGAYHPNALRRMVKMLSQRGLTHLLLMGTGQSSPLKPGESPAENVIVTYHTEYAEEDRFNSRDHCTDQYFGILTDAIPERLVNADAPVSIAVGRAPVKNITEAEAFVNKCLRYLDNPAEAGHISEALIISGFGDENAHLNSALQQGATAQRLMPGATVHKALHSRFPSLEPSTKSPLQLQFIKTRLSGRPRYVDYTGHATEDQLDMDFTKHEIANTVFGSSPIFFIAGCRTGWFDRPNPCIGTAMSVMEHGPIVTIATSREAYMSKNHILNNAFTEYLYNALPDATIGEVFTLALNNSPGKTNPTGVIDQIVNNYLYNFLGDPAMPVYAPSGRITATVDGPTSSPALKPLKISGTVTNSGGALDRTFNGTLEFSLYAPEQQVKTQSPDASDVEEGDVIITTDDTEILSASATVSGGKWELTITPPALDTPGACRFNMHAVSSDRRTAFGGGGSLNITDPDESATYADSTPPEITITLDTPGATANVVTGPEPTLVITIADSGSGLRLNRTSVAGLPEISLDGKAIEGAAYGLRPAEGGVYTLSRRLGPLARGYHRIDVTARDNAGNVGRSELEFTISPDPVTATLSASVEIARHGIDFYLSHDAPSTPQATLLILDSAGQTVHAASVSFPYHWDFRGADGATVPDGSYRAYALLSANATTCATPAVNFLIVK